MSLSATKHSERTGRCTWGRDRFPGFATVACLVAVTIAVAGSKVFAQCGCGSKDKEPPAVVHPKTGEQPKVAETPEKSDSASEAKATGPHWVCDKPSITLDPVWRGEPLVYKFSFRNDGTEDLRVKLRGG